MRASASEANRDSFLRLFCSVDPVTGIRDCRHSTEILQRRRTKLSCWDCSVAYIVGVGKNLQTYYFDRTRLEPG
jgi:hypothetical protein